MDNAVIYVKEYDSIHILCQYLDDDGLGINLDTVQIHSELSSLSGGIKYPFTIEVTNKETGEFALLLRDSLLRSGTYLVDILFESLLSGRKVASDTFTLKVDKSITTGT